MSQELALLGLLEEYGPPDLTEESAIQDLPEELVLHVVLQDLAEGLSLLGLRDLICSGEFVPEDSPEESGLADLLEAVPPDLLVSEP
jgi:hypothetical protein